jgi:hypothetical protein
MEIGFETFSLLNMVNTFKETEGAEHTVEKWCGYLIASAANLIGDSRVLNKVCGRVPDPDPDKAFLKSVQIGP